MSWGPGRGSAGHQTLLLCLIPDPLFMVPKLGVAFLLEHGLEERGEANPPTSPVSASLSGPHQPWLAVAITNFVKILGPLRPVLVYLPSGARGPHRSGSEG